MRCRSLTLLAILALALALPAHAGSAPFERAAMPLADGADRTTALPMGAPVPTGSTGLGPGTYLLITFGGSTFACTANYVWRAGDAHYLGAAGHCFLPEGAVASHGPGADSNVSNVRVRACIARCEVSMANTLRGTTVELGAVEYARQTRDGRDIGNDFGLVRIPDALLGEIRTGLPVWGATSHVRNAHAGDLTCLYGNGVVVGETYLTKARLGTGIATLSDGSWRAAIASAPGDSGSAVASCKAGVDGTRAVAATGVLTHLSATGIAGTTMPRAQQLALEAGLAISPVL